MKPRIRRVLIVYWIHLPVRSLLLLTFHLSTNVHRCTGSIDTLWKILYITPLTPSRSSCWLGATDVSALKQCFNPTVVQVFVVGLIADDHLFGTVGTKGTEGVEEFAWTGRKCKTNALNEMENANKAECKV